MGEREGRHALAEGSNRMTPLCLDATTPQAFTGEGSHHAPSSTYMGSFSIFERDFLKRPGTPALLVVGPSGSADDVALRNSTSPARITAYV